MLLICCEISSVALPVWVARFFDFGRDDGEAFAGFAGAGRFDGGVEGQEIGLAGDIGDQLHDGADFLRRIRQLLDLGVGGHRLAGGLAGDLRATVTSATRSRQSRRPVLPWRRQRH